MAYDVSVVIPHYNSSNELVRAVNSVLNQTYKVREIIIVDDCSPKQDELNEAINRIDSNLITLIKHTENKNGSAARNTGIKASKGTHIALLDCDDFWKPNYIESSIQAISTFNCDGVFANLNVWHDLTGKKVTHYQSRNIEDRESAIDFILGTGKAQTSSFFMTKESAIDTLFDESLKRHQDYDFFVRFAQVYDFKHHDNDDVITLWEINKPRRVDFSSCISFYQKHQEHLSVKIKSQYLSKMLYACYYNKGQNKFIKFYKSEIRKVSSIMSTAFVLSCLPRLFWNVVIFIQGVRKSN